MPDLANGSRSTPLYARHAALGASFTDFGGWSMPVRYTSDLEEHRAVRERAGLFDVSHMAQFIVEGDDAGDYLDHALAGRLSSMSLGRAKYSLVLDPRGGVIDDVIVYHLDPGWYLVIANAANRDAVAAALRERVGGFRVAVEDASDSFALLALQGPAARRILEACPEIYGYETPLDDLGYYRATRAESGAEQVMVAYTGYTGEAGYEILVASAAAERLWNALLASGEAHGLVPCGLAARDTLRLEAGMPLYGHELTRETLPAQAGLARVVAADKDGFVGEPAAQPLAEDAPVLVGLVADGRRAGRAGYAVTDVDGSRVGEITSGALSPTLGHPIAMAYVTPAVAAVGTELRMDVRGTLIPATVTALPFYRRTS